MSCCRRRGWETGALFWRPFIRHQRGGERGLCSVNLSCPSCGDGDEYVESPFPMASEEKASHKEVLHRLEVKW